MKFKWIAGLASVCIISAIAASALTAALLIKGVVGPGLVWKTSGSGETTRPDQTTETKQTSASPNPTPTLKPTPSVKPTATPTTAPTPTLSPEPSGPPTPTISPTIRSALEELYLWQVHDLLERIYDATSQSVVGIKIEVAATSTSSKMTNEGSGVIITGTGDIAINASLLTIALDNKGKVLANAKINVLIKNISDYFAATLVGRDQMSGLAVIHINSGDLALGPVKFVDKTELKVGQMVLTIGYPEQIYASNCMTSGFISGLQYPVVLEDGTELQTIQTSAPITASCLGGPLLNLEGEVIGLTCRASNINASDPMSYALMGSDSYEICMDLIELGYVSGRSWLGVKVLSEANYRDLQKLYSLPDGLFIADIYKGGPAASVDLRKGDVMTKINDTEVSASLDLGRYMLSQPVGTLVVITVYRRTDGKYHEIEVYLQEYTG